MLKIDGWIDFEKEIVPVIGLFEYIFSLHYRFIDNRSGNGVNAHISKSKFDSQFLRVAKYWKKYIDESDSGTIYVKSPFASRQYGILKKKILKCLREEFEEFIYAFEIYLVEFVSKKKNIQLLKQINQLAIDKVISFNYTLTEEVYGITSHKVHHIHGKLREDFNTRANNMVLGLNEKENQNMDFIYFVKYFQRIQKKSGVIYKEFVDDFKISSLGYKYREEYTLYIYMVTRWMKQMRIY